jgi:WD40 repeat protein
MLKLRRTLRLLAAAALAGASVLIVPGCGKGESAGEGRRKSERDSRDEGRQESERGSGDGGRRASRPDPRDTEGNPPADGGPTPYSLHVDYLALSPDGGRLLTSYRVENRHPSFGPLRSLSLWDTNTGKELWAVLGNEPLGNVRWLPDGKHFLAVAPSRKGRLSVWDAGPGVPLRDFGDGSEKEQVLAVSADGKRALSAAGVELRVVALPSGETISYLGGANGVAISGALSPDGTWALANFAAYQGSDAMALWQVGKPKPAHVWGPRSEWWGAGFSPDGTKLLSSLRIIKDGNEKFYLVLLDRDSSKELWRAEGWAAKEFSPDGKQILGVRGAKEGRYAFGRLDAATGRPLWAVQAEGLVASICFSADGRRAAASLGELSSRPGPRIIIQVWDATSGKSLRQWQVPEKPPPPPRAGKP